MKIAKVFSAQNDCLDGQIIQVEVDISRGLHAFSVVGMADKAVAEAKDRIASAIKHSGYKSPKSRNEKVVISLAPAQLPKEGTGFDLAMAIGYLIASQDIRPSPEIAALAGEMLFIGELALDGNLRGVRGILSIVKTAKERGIKHLFLPKENAGETFLIQDISIYAANTLHEVISHLEGERPIAVSRPATDTPRLKEETDLGISFHNITGQETAKRALRIALAGRHSIALIGPPGTGKTLLAQSARSISPDLAENERLEVMTIHSSAHSIDRHTSRPPFQAPHHSASYAAVIGGANKQPIGEITLAHKGILFLDEFPEFDRRVIEALRQPMEEKVVRIARANQRRELPADCIIIIAMNPCPCGYRGSLKHPCTCSQAMLRKYEEKISGPIIDRIDLWVPMEQPSHLFIPKAKKVGKVGDDKTSTTIRESISAIRTLQKNRSRDSESNDTYGNITDKALILLGKRANDGGLSNRGFHRTLAVARTIADLEGSAKIEEEHILEALQYRREPF